VKRLGRAESLRGITARAESASTTSRIGRYDRDHPESRRYYKLSALDVHGNKSGVALLTPEGTLGVEQGEPLAFSLEGVRPNPMSDRQLSVHFVLPTEERARLEVLDINGRRVATQELVASGRHVVSLGRRARLSPGVYMVRLRQGRYVHTTRATVLR
jgi:hypothetical protein